MMILHIASQTMGFDEGVDCIEFGICDVASFRWDGVVIIRLITGGDLLGGRGRAAAPGGTAPGGTTA